MNKLNKTIPEGTRDLIFAEAELYDSIASTFAKIYSASGFKKIDTPTVENYDLIESVNRSINQENLYKLNDNTGHLLVIRPDNTTPIARVVATKLRSAELPLKIYYNQSIYRINGDYSGKRNEILQSGIELVGATGLKADLLCIVTALDALRSQNLKCKLEIGHVGFFNALLNELEIDDDEAETVRSFVEAKNFVSLNMLDKNLQIEKIRRLPLLFGGEEVFDEAYRLAENNVKAIEALEYVKKLYRMLVFAGYGDYIMVDMGIVHKFDYYTGTVFRGYVENAGEPVLKGGRYDRLLSAFDYDVPATGFAINVCAVADALISKSRMPVAGHSDCIIYYDDATFDAAIKLKNEYQKDGNICELSVFNSIEETYKYAKSMNISNVIDLTKSSEETK